MSQQASNLPRPVQIIGQYKILIGMMALLGLLAGAVFAALDPPGSDSQAAVVFIAPSCPAGAVCGGPAFSLPYAEVGWLKANPGEVRVKAEAGNVLSVSVVAGTAAEATALAEAAGRSYLAYAGSLSYLGEHASAKFIEAPGAASEPASPKHLLDGALLGVLFGALAGIIAALAAGQTIIDPVTLRERLGVGEGARGPDPETGYASTGIPLEQLALEHSRQRAAGDESQAELP
jgi:hypothetical protein